MAKETEKYTVEELKTIVAAGMSITEARTLLEDGYKPEDVLGIAELQAEQKQQASASALHDAARVAADHTEKIRNPSNKIHPAISNFSYPEGDVAKPRVTLPYEFLYNGYPCHKFPDTEHWRELELMAQLQPGEYRVICKDSSQMQVSVTGDRDANGKLTKIDVRFPVTRENKSLIPPKSVVLYQMVYAGQKTPKRLFVEASNEWLNITFDETVHA
jgi:hypothetical protein